MRRTEFTKFKPNDQMSLVDRSALLNWSRHLLLRAALLLGLALFWSFSAGAQCTLVCNDDAQLSLPGPDANCEALVTAGMILTSPTIVCPGPKTVYIFDKNGNTLPQAPYGLQGNIGSLVGPLYIGQRLTVRVRDNTTGNHCWGHITVEDKLPPVLINCRDTVLYCIQNPKPQNQGGVMPNVIATDCGGTPTLVYSDQLTNGNCQDTFSVIIVRTWVATDRFGNASTCSQRIILRKVSLSNPLVQPVCPDNVSLECNSYKPPKTTPDSTGYPTITLGGIAYPIIPGGAFTCELASSYSDEIFDLCGGGLKILRTWTIYDWCLPTTPGLNPFTCIQVIKVEDKRPPVITCPAPIIASTNSWSCTANVNLPPATVRDSCSTFTVQVLTPVGVVNGNGGLAANVPVGVHTLTYVATDDCGNASTCTVSLTVRDNVPPVPVCDEHTIVSLTSDGTAVAHASTFDDGSSDNCGIKEFQVRRMPDTCQDTTYWDDHVTFDCCDIGKRVMVIFRVFDQSNNYNDCMVEVQVQDKLPPVVHCPPDKSIDCSIHITDYAAQFGTATASDNCELDTIIEQVRRNVDQCGVGYIDRYFIGIDKGGRRDTCIQRITVLNNYPFTIDDIDWPEDWTTDDCGASTDPNDIPCNVVNYCKPILAKSGCGLVAVTYTDQLLPIAFPACYKILRKWIVIDWCQYDPNSNNSYGYWTHTQIIKVIDVDPPVVTCPPDTVLVDNTSGDCSGILVTIPAITATDCSPILFYTVKYDFGNNGTFDTTFAGADGSGVFPNGTHKIHFKVEDNCGNFSICDVTVIVRDRKKPTPVCLNGVSATLMPNGQGGGMVTLTPEMFNNGSFDNCTPRNKLKLSISPKDFTCAELGLNLVRLTVTDEDGNSDWCETFVDIQDNMGACTSTANLRIVGAVKNESGAGIENVKVDLNGRGNLLSSLLTDPSGQFNFFGLVAGHDYSIAPSLNEEIDNGLSTFDLVLISKHVLSVKLLDSPYKIIAADANRSGNVSTLDLVALRKVVLRVDDKFPNNNTSWRFIDKKFQFPDPMNPFSTPFPEAVNFNNLSSTQLAADFVAVKVGDVNGSAKANTILTLEERSYRGNLVFTAEDRSFEAGEIVSIPVSAEDFTGVQGFQFTLEFNSTVFELAEIQPGILDKLSEANFGLTRVNEGIITTSWDNSKTTLTGKTGALFTLHFRALSSGQISQTLKISSQLTEAEAYAATANADDLEIRNVRLKFNGGVDATAGFELYQNTPNPFSQSTVIGFNLPEASFATLTVYDLSGKVLKNITGTFAKGFNTVTVSKSELGSHGVLYYRLETPEHTATRKMVIVK